MNMGSDTHIMNRERRKFDFEMSPFKKAISLNTLKVN